MKHIFRISVVKLTFSILILSLVFRIYWLAVEEGNGLKIKAQRQNSISVEFANGRNDIIDRNFCAITGVNKRRYAAIFSLGNKTVDFELCNELSKQSNENAYEIYARLYKYGKTSALISSPLPDNFEENHKNIKILEVPSRYANNSSTATVVGYVMEGKGVTGVEKAFDEFLSNSEGLSVYAQSDALKNFIPGNGFVVAGQNVGNKILKTTIDKRFTEICHNAMSEAKIKGGAVLLDLKTFDVLAMVSTPSYDQNNIADYLNSTDGNLNNKCLQNYDLGSVFKIIVTAAALEQNVINPDEEYFCKGYIDIAGKRFECHKEGGHGKITFEEAFMYSCNPIFIDIGVKTGYTNIIEMAKRFGLGEKNLYPLAFDQNCGTLPDENNYYIADLVNLSIGQGNLSATVLQGVILSAVIANEGKSKAVNIADSIIDNVGQMHENLRFTSEKQIIDEDIAKIIYEMMLKTNEFGTGKPANVEKYGSGGKTGSAETGWFINGERQQHGWYSGFFPAKNPEYALCILVENGKSGGESACPIFKKIAEEIMKLDE